MGVLLAGAGGWVEVGGAVAVKEAVWVGVGVNVKTAVWVGWKVAVSVGSVISLVDVGEGAVNFCAGVSETKTAIFCSGVAVTDGRKTWAVGPVWFKPGKIVAATRIIKMATAREANTPRRGWNNLD